MLRPIRAALAATTGAVLVAALASTAAPPASAAGDRPASTRRAAPAAQGSQAAERALDAVAAVLGRHAGTPAADTSTARATGGRAAPAGVGDGGDATQLFRSLLAQRGALTGPAAARASSYLARPTAGRTRCATVCVHWSVTGKQAATDRFAAKVLHVVDHVATTYLDAGYRRPLRDGRTGGNRKLDVYLRDIGNQGYYGYCTVDHEPSAGRHTAPAYCVLDNDFSHREFPNRTPVQNLEVTAAHEYFHAVQFAYDYDDDPWFQEATATWAEDEVYDGINDNRQYLRDSQIVDPSMSMDQFDQGSAWQYGQWIFIRYLTEHFPQAEGPMPRLVLDLWRHAAASHAPNEYSVQAIDDVLGSRGTSLAAQFAAYAAANQDPAASYSEGATYPSPGFWRDPASSDGVTRLSATQPDVTRSLTSSDDPLDHLASRTSYVQLTGAAAGRPVRVRVATDADPATTTLTLHYTGADGTPRDQVVALGPDGTADTTLTPGAADGVTGFALDLANGGSSYTACGSTTWGSYEPLYSCGGRSTSDATRLSVEYTLQ